MTSYKGPAGSDEESGKINNPDMTDRKMPDFIYVDQTHEDPSKIGSTQQDTQKMFGSIQSMSKGNQPFYLRILALICSCLIFLGSFIILFGFLIYLSLSLIAFRQSTFLNQQTAIGWRAYKKTMVFALGSFICVFNISFGVGIVLMYFMLTGEKLNSRMMDEFTKHQQ